MKIIVISVISLSLLSCATRNSQEGSLNYFQAHEKDYFAIDPQTSNSESAEKTPLMCAYIRKRENGEISYLSARDDVTGYAIKESEFIDHFIKETLHIPKQLESIDLGTLTPEEFAEVDEKYQQQLARIIVTKRFLAVVGASLTYTAIGAVAVGVVIPAVSTLPLSGLGALLSEPLFKVAAASLVGASGIALALSDDPGKNAASVVVGLAIVALSPLAIGALPATLFVHSVEGSKQDRERARETFDMAKQIKEYRELHSDRITIIQPQVGYYIARAVSRSMPDKRVSCPEPKEAWKILQDQEQPTI